MKKITTQFIAASTLFIWAKVAFSHDGHGLSSPHWHATDTLGFVTVSAMIAAAIWLSRK